MFNNDYSLSDIAAVSGREDGFFGGNNGWWIILLFLFTMGGWGNGFGGGRVGVPATVEDVRSAVDQQTYGLADSTHELNSAITGGFHGVDNAICTLGYQTQQGLNDLAHQLSDCCCATQRLVERGFADTNYNLATQACDTRRAIVDGTRDIIENNNAGVRSILDFLTQDKIATLTAENQNLKFAASQAAQNAYLVNELRPCPVPAYTVPNPYAYYNPCGC